MLTNFRPSTSTRRPLHVFVGLLFVLLASETSTLAQACTPVTVPAGTPIKVHFVTTGGAWKITYTVGATPAKCFKVSPGQTVIWQAATSNTAHRTTIFFLPNHTPFVDRNNNPVHAFHGSNTDESTGGQEIGSHATIGAASGSYEAYIAVFDDNSGLTYTDDPKIIVGRPGEGEELTDIKEHVEDIQQQLKEVEEQLVEAIRRSKK